MPSPVLRSIFCQISCLLIPAALVGSTATAQAVTPQSGTRLFNGWSVTPAGTIIALDHLDVLVQDPDFVKPAGGMTSDLPLKMVVAPDGKALLAACAGFNNTGLAVIEMAGKKVVQFIPEPRLWNGLAFSGDGTRVFLSGGNSGKILVFAYKNGRLTPGEAVKPAPDERGAFLAGIAVHPRTGRLYVANEANHEVWVVDPKSLAREAAIPTGLHPHSCVFGADGIHLYVSNWGSRSVSIIDTAAGKRLRDQAVGIRPNDMALSPDGRLFVACSAITPSTSCTRRPWRKWSRGPVPGGVRRKERGKSWRPRSIRLRRKAAHPTPWPWHPTARRCTWPTPITTT